VLFNMSGIHCRWVTALILVPSIALSQPVPQWPGVADIERALKEKPLLTPERLATQPRREIPRIAPNTIDPPATGTIDIAAMARQGAALTMPPPDERGASALRIFVTLDMPRASLQRLVDQAERSGSTLVLRGLKAQSMRQTIAAVGELIETRRVSWVIDPNAFTRFSVSSAPTFVLSLADEPTPAIPSMPAFPGIPGKAGLNAATDLPRCGGSSCTTPASQATYISVSGDVSLDYALDAMMRRSVDAAPRAKAILQRLRKS
jgi:conjugal transfer pilus assembly protein TrbC